MGAVRGFAKARAYFGKHDSPFLPLEHAISDFRWIGRVDRLPPLLIMLAGVRGLGFDDHAESELNEALTIARQTSQHHYELDALIGLATLELSRFEHDEALLYHAKAVQFANDSGLGEWDQKLEELRTTIEVKRARFLEGSSAWGPFKEGGE
jgi:hypothetical protein